MHALLLSTNLPSGRPTAISPEVSMGEQALSRASAIPSANASRILPVARRQRGVRLDVLTAFRDSDVFERRKVVFPLNVHRVMCCIMHSVIIPWPGPESVIVCFAYTVDIKSMCKSSFPFFNAHLVY